MGGFFGTVSKTSCVTDLFYGTDYNSHLGTKRGGLATYSEEKGFIRSIHKSPLKLTSIFTMLYMEVSGMARTA